jgi:hypothetical protein
VLVEYVTRGQPGGLLGAMQFVVATRALLNTMEGMLETARGHAVEPHDGVRFVRPDGSPLEGDPRGGDREVSDDGPALH